MKKSSNASSDVITVNSHSGKKNICADSIVYIKSEGKKTELFLEDDTSVVACHLLKWFGERLEAKGFKRCHKSYIVNLQKVDYYCYEYLILGNKEWIPVSRGLREGISGMSKSKAEEL